MITTARKTFIERAAPDTAAEQAKLDKISKAGSDGNRLLVETADPKIDEAIERIGERSWTSGEPRRRRGRWTPDRTCDTPPSSGKISGSAKSNGCRR